MVFRRSLVLVIYRHLKKRIRLCWHCGCVGRNGRTKQNLFAETNCASVRRPCLVTAGNETPPEFRKKPYSVSKKSGRGNLQALRKRICSRWHCGCGKRNGCKFPNGKGRFSWRSNRNNHNNVRSVMTFQMWLVLRRRQLQWSIR